MSGDRKPQKGDRVRVTFEAEYEGDGRDGSPPRVKVEKGGMPALVSVADDSVFEVLEPADDPSKDAIGTVRDMDGHQWARVNFGLYISAAWACVDWDLKPRGHDRMAGSAVIGSVPGTPAAEQSVSVEQVEQWETDDLELAVDPHKPVVLVQAETTQPRVFTSDGPEPPADVKALEWLDRDPNLPYPYAKRMAGGWGWVESSGDEPQGAAFQWRRFLPGRYQEVQS